VVERYAYDPFGTFAVLDGSWGARPGGSLYAWKYQFQGQPWDADTGTYHMRKRDYSPSLGRWLQNDPIGFASQDVNHYRGFANTPIARLAPLGLATEPEFPPTHLAPSIPGDYPWIQPIPGRPPQPGWEPIGPGRWRGPDNVTWTWDYTHGH